MDYQLSDDEFRSLEIVRDQLGLIAGLLSHARDEDAIEFVTVAQFLVFVEAQQGAVARVLKALLNERQQRACDRIMAARAAAAEPAVPHVVIAPELLMGLMDAASGVTTDSNALLGLWDTLYDASVEHRSYQSALHHFRNMLRDRGLVIRTEFQDGECNRSFVMTKPSRESHAKPKAVKSRKRSQLVANV